MMTHRSTVSIIESRDSMLKGLFHKKSLGILGLCLGTHTNPIERGLHHASNQEITAYWRNAHH